MADDGLRQAEAENADAIDAATRPAMSKAIFVRRGFALGWAARQAVIDELTRQRDEARDLAFRAAFAPEEGARLESALHHPEHDGDDRAFVTYVGAEEDFLRDMSRHGGSVVRRVVGPWKPVP